jgi:hypothetical protein
MIPPSQSPNLRSPVGKYQSTAWAGGFETSSIIAPPLPGMYCFSTPTTSLPVLVSAGELSRSEPVLKSQTFFRSGRLRP